MSLQSPVFSFLRTHTHTSTHPPTHMRPHACTHTPPHKHTHMQSHPSKLFMDEIMTVQRVLKTKNFVVSENEVCWREERGNEGGKEGGVKEKKDSKHDITKTVIKWQPSLEVASPYTHTILPFPLLPFSLLSPFPSPLTPSLPSLLPPFPPPPSLPPSTDCLHMGVCLSPTLPEAC